MRSLLFREGGATVLVLFGLTALSAMIFPWLALLPGSLLVLTVYFFRDPERSTPGTDYEVVAPADGRIMWVREVDEPRFFGGPSVAISIFLSAFDVHVNRAPMTGQVVYRDYEPGRFLAAWGHNVGEHNERAYVGLEGNGYRALVIQIAGVAARRIRTWVELGDEVQRGERLGMIKFGSCTQVFLPPGTEVTVQVGDRVRGGETVIGRLPR